MRLFKCLEGPASEKSSTVNLLTTPGWRQKLELFLGKRELAIIVWIVCKIGA